MAVLFFFFQIICTFIKLIFVIFASVEIPVQDKIGCWNEGSDDRLASENFSNPDPDVYFRIL